jgi:DNA-binding NarL/FixJ family response regulator
MERQQQDKKGSDMSTRIILADDHKIVREGLRSLLEEQPDLEVIAEAEDGQTAVRLAQELSPDLVIMDVNMPGMNGIMAAHQIIEASPDVKILALSMHDNKRFVMKMLNTGAAGYLLKDCAFEELTHAINAVLSGGKYLSPEIAGIVVELSLEHWAEHGPPVLSVLSPREIEVAKLMTGGKSTSQIASALRLSKKTIESHRRRIFKKLGVHSAAELTLWAVREGLVTPES